MNRDVHPGPHATWLIINNRTGTARQRRTATSISTGHLVPLELVRGTCNGGEEGSVFPDWVTLHIVTMTLGWSVVIGA
jgi:hypothetical protein